MPGSYDGVTNKDRFYPGVTYLSGIETTPITIDVAGELQRNANNGYITSDNSDIDISIDGNTSQPIRVLTSEVLDIDEINAETFTITTAGTGEAQIRYYIK